MASRRSIFGLVNPAQKGGSFGGPPDPRSSIPYATRIASLNNTGLASGSITIARPSSAIILLFGGAGNAESGTLNGAGGGGAVFKRIPLLTPGQVLTWNCPQSTAASGTPAVQADTTVTLPSGTVVGAQPGGTGAAGGLGGYGYNGDIMRRGGNGGLGANQNGMPGEQGGAGGAGTASGGGGGGRGGFQDLGLNLPNSFYSGLASVTGYVGVGTGGNGGAPGNTGWDGGGFGAFAGNNTGPGGEIILMLFAA